MEILDDAIDNMGLSNKKVSKLLLVLFIAIPLVFITIASMCKISNNFLPFEGFQKVLLGGKYQNNNIISMELEGRGIVQNMTHENLGGGGEEKNNTIEGQKIIHKNFQQMIQKIQPHMTNFLMDF
ncbi:hypothetical protein Ahy_B05g078731 isoform E [Arachis hypogaea]|uniref:Uncharacterized protein n=1 Tax=Arachis hypogaea TaxID=3818 RepID=A0A444Z7W7_ARAHY|nr:hypothetical protein Ahy_B05g078731 isoform E [Arachis hypogaea]